jgi:hypothetical protein
MKVHLGGQEFQIDDESKHGVPKWLRNQDKASYDAGISNLPGRWENNC